MALLVIKTDLENYASGGQQRFYTGMILVEMLKTTVSWVCMYKILQQMMKTEPECQTIVDLLINYVTFSDLFALVLSN
jgi:hypothetical protein